MKNKKGKTNAIRLLEQKKIPYLEQEFPVTDAHLSAREVAQALAQDEGVIFKTLVTTGKQTGIVVAVIPSNQELDLKKLAKASGNKKMEMLHLNDLEGATGYIRGGCSPIGMKKNYPTFFDQSGLDLPVIHVSAGRRGLQMSVAPKALSDIVSGQFIDLCIKKDHS